MNTALLEELVRRKAERLHVAGLPIAEAIDMAGDEILNRMAGSGHGSRFCLRMWLNGAKKRIAPESCSGPSGPEGDKQFPLILSCPVESFFNKADISRA
ncbi:hypothetical protein [Maridesulfovibrio sp.]|uniref:hypothetical protein n=1 Tax=Maridesulfovibrio sp. TaxID=2795000 RepID=UPI002A18AE34|nr:hypothetical protein [Maridesulfovibrio sp.]